MNRDNLKKERKFVLTRKPSRQGNPYPPSVFIPGECEVYDPTTNTQRTAVYLAGAKSIWADEIPALREEKVIQGKKIIIKNGFLSVSPKEKNKLDYLLVCGYNESNDETRINSAVIFKELDVEKLAEKSFENSKILDNARYFVNNADIREVRAYGLAWAKTNAEYKAIQDMSEYEVRVYMRKLAEKNPSMFVESMQDSAIRNKVRIIHAIYSDILILNEQDRTLSWKGGDVLIKAPNGLDVVVYFAQMAIDNPKYKEAFETMTSLMKNDEPKSENLEREETVKEEPKSTQEQLIDSLLSSKVLTGGKNNMWFKYKKDDEELKWKTKKDLIKALKEDKVLLAELISQTF